MANNDQSRGPEPAGKGQAANGELQRANEELESLREELRSLKEESARVNAGLQARIDALHKSEITSRALLEGSPVCNKIIDLDSRLQYMSAAGVNALKIPDIKALYGCTYPPDFYAESMRAPLVEHLDRAKAGEISSVECPLFDMDGNTIWYNTTFVPARDDEGRVEYIIASSVDITERKRAEAALRKSEITGRALLEGSPVCNKIIDLNSRLQYMSAAGVDALKIPDIKTLYGCTYPPEFYAESMRAPMVEHLDRAKAGEISSVECPLLDMEGNTIWYHTTFVPARNDEGRIEYIIAASVDITERKRAEADRLTLGRQLLHAQKFESLGVMAGAIAHEFNKLLTDIMGYADAASDNLPAMSPARGHVQEIEKASRCAAALADQMLAYSGKGRLVSEPIEVGELLVEMVHLFEVSISENADLNCVFADKLPACEGDATQIRQVITNLIINASESIGDKRGVIRLSTGLVKCDGNYLTTTGDVLRTPLGEPLREGLYVYVEVSDTGCGMDDETIQKIYDPFFTTKFPGRGLGMSVVLGIVRSHKGAIEIRSEVGAGTAVKVLFSATDPADNRVAAPTKNKVGAGDTG